MMMIRHAAWGLASLLAGGIGWHGAFAHDDHQHHGGAPETLGHVHFAVSCTPTAQQAFDRAMALQHSFWYQAAGQGFAAVLREDPSCAMAHWGTALSLLNNPFSPNLPANLKEGAALLDKAQALGPKTPREAGYIAALRVYYTDVEAKTQPVRSAAYAEAMGALAAANPDDREAAILYALALDVAASPADKTYANQIKAAAILEKEFVAQPQHPGVAHYLIHTYDVPALASQGIPAALRYAKIAASAPHAQHMPSHIFTRVGYWQQSIDTNRRSAEIARAEKEPSDEMHAYDYMAYGYLQTGQDGAASKVRETIAGVMAKPEGLRNAAFYAAAAIPARIALERDAWTEAASLTSRPSGFAYADAITEFARGLGAARAGQLDTARAALTALRGLEDKLRQGRDAYWTEQVGIQGDVVTAWIARAEQRTDAIDLMRAAVVREDKTEKSPITPGPLSPARELLGDMLLEAGRNAEALAAYEATQKTEPNRFRSLYGAARAAELTGDRDKAKRYYAKLVELCAKADGERPPLRAAKAYLAKG